MNHKGWIRAIGASLLVFLFIVIIFVLFNLIDSLLGTSLFDLTNTNTSLGKIFFLFLFISSSFLAVRTIEGKWNLKGLGLIVKDKANGRDIIFGLLLGPSLFILFLIINILFGSLTISVINFDLEKLCFIVLLYVFVSFSEEIFTRAIFQRYLHQSFNKYISLALASIVFALMHLANPNISTIGFIHLVIAGVVLGGVYFITQSLWFSISYHFSWNFFQSLLGFNVSGNDAYSLLKLDLNDQVFMHGGAFGAEGSLVMLAFQLLSVIFIGYFYNKKAFKIHSKAFLS